MSSNFERWVAGWSSDLPRPYVLWRQLWELEALRLAPLRAPAELEVAFETMARSFGRLEGSFRSLCESTTELAQALATTEAP